MKRKRKKCRSNQVKLFVYGTLKRGFSNHNFLEEATFLDNAITLKSYLLISPKKEYPYLLEQKGKKVEGELYCIKYKDLKKIDRLEESGSYYLRKKIKLKDSQGFIHLAFCYFLKKPLRWNRKGEKSFKRILI